MPIHQDIPSPYNAETLPTWSYCSNVVIDMEARTIRLTFLRYADRDSSYASKPPIGRKEFVISGPDFDAEIAANASTFDAIRTLVDRHALSQPEFAGGAEVD